MVVSLEGSLDIQVSPEEGADFEGILQVLDGLLSL